MKVSAPRSLIVLHRPLSRSGDVHRSVLWECHPSNKPEDVTAYRVPRIAPGFAGECWRRLREINHQWGCDFYEGLVAKRADSVYPIQLRSAQAETPFWVRHQWAW